MSGRPQFNQRNIIHKAGIPLDGGTVTNVFIVQDHPVIFTGCFMRITEVVSAHACTMIWRNDPDSGAVNMDFGAAVDINAAALGDMFWSELDGSAINKVGAASELSNFSSIHDNTAIAFSGRGLFVHEGVINIVMANSTPTSGIAEMWIEYEMILDGTGSVIQG